MIAAIPTVFEWRSIAPLIAPLFERKHPVHPSRRSGKVKGRGGGRGKEEWKFNYLESSGMNPRRRSRDRPARPTLLRPPRSPSSCPETKTSFFSSFLASFSFIFFSLSLENDRFSIFYRNIDILRNEEEVRFVRLIVNLTRLENGVSFNSIKHVDKIYCY